LASSPRSRSTMGSCLAIGSIGLGLRGTPAVNCPIADERMGLRRRVAVAIGGSRVAPGGTDRFGVLDGISRAESSGDPAARRAADIQDVSAAIAIGLHRRWAFRAGTIANGFAPEFVGAQGVVAACRPCPASNGKGSAIGADLFRVVFPENCRIGQFRFGSSRVEASRSESNLPQKLGRRRLDVLDRLPAPLGGRSTASRIRASTDRSLPPVEKLLFRPQAKLQFLP